LIGRSMEPPVTKRGTVRTRTHYMPFFSFLVSSSEIWADWLTDLVDARVGQISFRSDRVL